MYLKLNKNGEIEKFPYSKTDLRSDYPNISFPVDISDDTAKDFNVFKVEVVGAFDEGLELGKPYKKSGVFFANWEKVNNGN